ncbi:ABC transporter permease [Bosea caraganae]|uniref:ABC transporter permease n=1 Tax=Bosea caraganae TaxID=2763117 RepID=UPI0015EFF29F|nr:ABC transporter permease [Bosea caraganae]
MSTDQAVRTKAGERRAVLVWQIAFGLGALALWELTGRVFGSTWTSLPSQIAQRLLLWGGTDLFRHVYVTLTEVFVGLALGTVAGVVAGLALGRTQTLALVLRPIIVTLYSVPLVTMAPLLILWFGLEMESKIVLVTVVVFFLMFFNTFAGVQSIDPLLVTTLDLMGATTLERYRKVIAPAAMAWIFSGIKIALPYALSAATTGELLGGSYGLGTLLSRAGSQFDMTGLYTALIVLLVIGILLSEGVAFVENHLLRWRHVAE